MIAPNYIRDEWYRPPPIGIKVGDYVLATKYADGDPGDHFCVGFYHSSYDNGVGIRHLVVDNNGKQFRRNGFRRIARVSHDRGTWIVNHLQLIEGSMNRFSVWHWFRAPWKELERYP